MLKTTSESLINFLNFWNNHHLTDEDNCAPLNMYNISALSAGLGFTLKWFVRKDDFEKIAEEISYIFGEDKSRMLLVVGEDRIELEIDTQNIISEFKEEIKEIDTLMGELEKCKTDKN